MTTEARRDSTDGTEVVGGMRQWLVPMPVKVLQILSGYLLFRWIAILAARHLLGFESECRVRFDGERLRLTRTSRLLGRTISESEEVVLGKDVLMVGYERRYPHMLLLLGALGLLLGAIVGVGWIVDGIQASYVPIAIFGLGALAVGVGFDVGLGALADYIGPRGGLMLTLRKDASVQLFASRFRIVGVPEEGARKLLEAIEAGARP